MFIFIIIFFIQHGFAGAVNPDRDPSGQHFFGNFYVGLYFDSINNMGMSQAFLSICNDSRRYKENDMWYHIPRFLYKERFLDDNVDNDDDNSESGKTRINQAGMIF